MLHDKNFEFVLLSIHCSYFRLFRQLQSILMDLRNLHRKLLLFIKSSKDNAVQHSPTESSYRTSIILLIILYIHTRVRAHTHAHTNILTRTLTRIHYIYI
jgi:hypothetical protein